MLRLTGMSTFYYMKQNLHSALDLDQMFDGLTKIVLLTFDMFFGISGKLHQFRVLLLTPLLIKKHTSIHV